MKKLLDRRWISLQEAAKRLGVSRSTVARWLRAAAVTEMCFGDSRNATVRFDAQEVENFLRRHVLIPGRRMSPGSDSRAKGRDDGLTSGDFDH